MSKEFKGIWIPKEIVGLKNIGSTQKMILSTIIALDNDKGCMANNRYFAEMFDISRTRVSLILKELSDKKYVTLLTKVNRGGTSKVKGGVQQKLYRVINFSYRGGLTKVKTYNTVDNTDNRIIDIKYPFESLEFFNQWQRWIKYKKDEHRFSYKTNDSQETALKNLFEDSGGRENVAIEMINRSIGNGHKGLFKQKSSNYGQSITDQYKAVDEALEHARLSHGNDQQP